MNDQYGRRIDYMRVSVTDRCNLRCVYCMPGEGFSFLPHEDILSFEEIERVCRIGVRLGITKIKDRRRAACAAGNTGSCREVKGYSGYR